MPTINPIPRPPPRLNPQILTLIGAPKIRKTLTLSKLPDSMFIVTDPGGCDYMTASVFDVREQALADFNAGTWKPADIDPLSMVNLLAYLETVAIPLFRKTRPCKRLIIDTLDEIEDWILADINSRRSRLLLMGDPGKDATGSVDSVIELRYGKGETMIYDRLQALWAKFINCADELIFVCHIRKGVYDPSGKPKDASSDIDLRGKVKKLPTKYSAAVGTLEQRSPTALMQELWVSFKAGADTAAGNRILRLENRNILLSVCEFVGGPPDRQGIVAPLIDPATREPKVKRFETFWKEIYLEPVKGEKV